MRILIACVLLVLVAIPACGPAPEPVAVVKPVPVVVERIAPNTAAIKILEAKLKACGEQSATYLEGWRKAEARYKYYETYWQPKHQPFRRR